MPIVSMINILVCQFINLIYPLHMLQILTNKSKKDMQNISEIKILEQPIAEKDQNFQKAITLNEAKQTEIKLLQQNNYFYANYAQANYEKQKQEMREEITTFQQQLTTKKQLINTLKNEQKQIQNNSLTKNDQLSTNFQKQSEWAAKFNEIKKVVTDLNIKAKGMYDKQNKQDFSSENIMKQCFGQLTHENTGIYIQIAAAISSFSCLKCCQLINQLFQDCISSLNPNRKKQLQIINQENVQNIMKQLKQNKFSKVWVHFERILDKVQNIQLQQQPVRFVQASELHNKIQEQRIKIHINNQKLQQDSKTLQLKSKINGLNQDVIKLFELTKQKQDLKKQHKLQIQQLNKQILSIQEQSNIKIKAQAAEAQKLKESLQRIQKNLERTQKNLETLKETVHERNLSIKNAKADIRQLKKQIKIMKSQMRDKDALINTLMKQKNQNQPNISLTDKILSQNSDKLNEQIKKNQMLSFQIRKLQKCLMDAQKYTKQIQQKAQKLLQQKLKDQQRKMLAHFQKKFNPHLNNIDFKFDPLSKIEGNIFEYKKNSELIISQILSQVAEQKVFVIEQVSKFVQKKIASSEFIYKWDKSINTDFTRILKDRQNFIAIFKLQQKNYKFGFFIESIGISESIAQDRAFLFSITDRKAFYQMDDSVASVFFALGTELIYFGNKEIRITNKSNIIKSTYGGIGNKYFNVKDKYQLFGISKDDITFSHMEIHCLKFE